MHLAKDMKVAGLLLLVVAGLLAGLFQPFLVEDSSLFYRDLSSFHYPLWAATAHAVSTGQFPWWGEGIHFGQPVAGNPNYLLFYPPAWLRFIMPPLVALHVFLMLHFLLAALAFYGLARRLHLSTGAAFWGGLAYAFSGISFSLTCVLNLVPYLVLIPALLAALDGCLAKPGGRSVAVLGLLGALTITVFEPYMVFGLLLLGAVFLWGRKPSLGKMSLARVCLAIVLAALLAAPVLVEGGRLLRHASRAVDGTTGAETLYALHPGQSFEFWIPNPTDFSFADRSGYRGGALYGGRDPYLLTFFAGLATLFLAGAALTSLPARIRWLSLATFLVFVFLAWGHFVAPAGWLLERVPLLAWGRYSQKMIIFAVAVLVMGAARGLDALGAAAANMRRLRLTAVVTGAALGGMVLFYGLDSRFTVAAMVPLSLGSAILLPVLFWLKPRQDRRFWRLHTAGWVLVLELLLGNRFALPFAPASFMTDPAPVIPLVQERIPAAGPARIAVEPHPAAVGGGRTDAYWYMSFLKNAGYPYFGLVHGVDYAFDLMLDRTQPRWLAVLREEYFRHPLEGRIRILQRCGISAMISPVRHEHPDLRLAGVIPLGGGLATHVYAVRHSLPRFGFAGDGYWVTDVSALPDMVRRMADEGGGPVMVSPVPGGAEEGAPNAGPVKEAAGHVALVQWRSGQVRLQTAAPEPGMLVLREGYFPGWQVTVDGRQMPLQRADGFFMAVALPAGRHQVSFQYVPAGHPVPLILSGMAFLLLAGLMGWPRASLPFVRNGGRAGDA